MCTAGNTIIKFKLEIIQYIHTHIHAQPQTKTFLTLKLSIADTRPFTWVCGWKVYYKPFLFNLLQIFYLLGVGLLLTFDLLACVDSQGMLYYYPSSVIF